MKPKKMTVKYDGRYPTLCFGTLILTVGKTVYQFEPSALRSCGSVWFDKDWDEHVEEGDWKVGKWPANFPEELKEQALEEINSQVPHGCCGGCV